MSRRPISGLPDESGIALHAVLLSELSSARPPVATDQVFVVVKDGFPRSGVGGSLTAAWLLTERRALKHIHVCRSTLKGDTIDGLLGDILYTEGGLLSEVELSHLVNLFGLQDCKPLNAQTNGDSNRAYASPNKIFGAPGTRTSRNITIALRLERVSAIHQIALYMEQAQHQLTMAWQHIFRMHG